MADAGVNTEGVSVNRSSFSSLREWGTKVINRFKHPTTPNLEINNQPVKTPKKEIPLQSGLHNLVESIKAERGSVVAAQSITELADDFYKHIEGLNPQLRQKVEQALNNGNEDVIDTLARIKLQDYSDAIKSRQYDFGQNGVKKVLAQQLIRMMGDRIKTKYNRQSAGTLMDLGLAATGKGAEILSKPPIKSSSALEEAEEIARISVAQSTTSQSLQPQR